MRIFGLIICSETILAVFCRVLSENGGQLEVIGEKFVIPAPAARAAEDKKAAEEEKEKVGEAPKAAPFSFLGGAKKVCDVLSWPFS